MRATLPPSADRLPARAAAAARPPHHCRRVRAGAAPRRPTVVVASAAAPPSEPAVVTGPRPFDALGVEYTGATHTFNGYKCAYAVAGDEDGLPVVLVPGFGASCAHWRRALPSLAQAGCRIYAIDLLGLGASEKPVIQYSTAVWRDQVLSFIADAVRPHPAGVVLAGNSLGSLVALLAAADAPPGTVAGLALLNIAGGMNNKAASDDWRIKLAAPLFALIDFVLSIPPVARALFDRVRQPETLAGVLASVYGDKSKVDGALVDLVAAPAGDPGALEAFVSIITGDPGPRPEDAVPRVDAPILFVWGDPDPFTPVDGPVGTFCRGLATTRPRTQFELLPGVGHCPQDDAPEKVAAVLVPWLRRVAGGEA